MFLWRHNYVTPWPIVLILVCMNREDPYLPTYTKIIKFIGGSVRKIYPLRCVRRVTKNSLVRRGLRVCNFLIASEGQRILNFPLRHQGAPNFLMSSKWWPLISHHVIKGPNSSLRYQGAPIVTSNFPSRYQGVPFIIASSRGPHFPRRVIKGTQISNIHHELCRPTPMPLEIKIMVCA